MNEHFADGPRASQDDEISLGELWQALRRRMWLIIGATLACGAIAAAYALSLTPIYRAEVVLTLVDDSDKTSGFGGLASQFGGLASLAGVSVGGSSNRVEALGTLGSKQLVESYITSQNLMPILFEDQWDESHKDWKTSIAKKPTLWMATDIFTKSIRSIAEDKKSGLIVLTVEWKNAATAARWANDLVRLANQTLRQRAISKSENNLAYLNTQLEKSSVVELREAIFRLIESEVKNVMLAQGSGDYAFKVIDPAVTPEKKAKPKRSLIVLVGAFLGMMLSCLYALAKGGRSSSPGRI